MKLFYSIVALCLFASCSSTRMIDSWKNREYANYQPKKVLIVGITGHLTARKIFEQRLKDKLFNEGIDAVESSVVFEEGFIDSKQTEEQIDLEVERLVNDGYDSILVSAVKGIDNEISYSGNKFLTGYYWHHFGRYYYLYQNVYFEHYNNYKVYHIEASLYNIKTNNGKSLIWVASYNVVDPIDINSTVNDYVKAIVKSLKKESLISKENN